MGMLQRHPPNIIKRAIALVAKKKEMWIGG